MSRVQELQAELQGTDAAIAHAERTLAANPHIPSVAATLRTIQKRRENLEEQFLAATGAQGLDVCGYRIELEDRPATIAGLTAVLSAFQKVFTSVYNAIERGPKLRSRTSAEITDATAFSFAYTYPGSVGIMMTLANDPQLIGGTKIDAAMQKTLELLRTTDPLKVKGLADTLGVPPVRFAHQWATENAKAGFGADITWRRDRLIKGEVRMQPREIELLASTLKGTIAEEVVTFIGELTHVDTEEKTFRMKLIYPSKDRQIYGTFDTAITSTHPVQLPQVYKATMNVLQRVVVEDGQEEITHFLLRLDPPPTFLPEENNFWPGN
jgi:hypothetical protein